MRSCPRAPDVIIRRSGPMMRRRMGPEAKRGREGSSPRGRTTHRTGSRSQRCGSRVNRVAAAHRGGRVVACSHLADRPAVDTRVAGRATMPHGMAHDRRNSANLYLDRRRHRVRVRVGVVLLEARLAAPTSPGGSRGKNGEAGAGARRKDGMQPRTTRLARNPSRPVVIYSQSRRGGAPHGRGCSDDRDPGPVGMLNQKKAGATHGRGMKTAARTANLARNGPRPLRAVAACARLLAGR